MSCMLCLCRMVEAGKTYDRNTTKNQSLQNSRAVSCSTSYQCIEAGLTCLKGHSVGEQANWLLVCGSQEEVGIMQTTSVI